VSIAALIGAVELLVARVGRWVATTDEERNIVTFVVTELEAVKMAMNGDLSGAADKAFDGVALFSKQSDLSKFLEAADVRRAKLVKQAADRVKFGFGTTPPDVVDDGT
jgi:hypothetical protein